jgi:NADPH:quinone reductase-like Zn-dependent oxidoreductase
MKAIVQERFGPPDVLRLVDTDLPEVGAGDVLVRVHAAALNPYDWHIMRGDPLVARLMGGVGLTRPKARVAGVDAAGRVEAVGANVRGLRPGDEVLGFCPGAFAEYARAEADKVVPKPVSLTFEQAAAVPMAGATALRGSGMWVRCGPGTGCWSTGPPAGVGTYAVQIAAALGAEVTGVCSTRNVELVRSIGAAHVVDYTTEDFTDGRARLRRDPRQRLQPAAEPAAPGIDPDRDPRAQRRRLTRPRGRGGGLHCSGGRGQRSRAGAAPTGPHEQKRENLLTLTGLIEAGKLTPVLDRTYPLADTAEGLRHLEQGHARGKVVITVPEAARTGRSAGTRRCSVRITCRLRRQEVVR